MPCDAAARPCLWIAADRHAAGTVLPIEAELCQILGVSRTIVREAIKTLAAKGMVAVTPKLGSRVLDEDSWHMFDPRVLQWRRAFRNSGAVVAPTPPRLQSTNP